MSTSWWVLVNLPIPYEVLDLTNLLQEYTLFALPNLLTSQSGTLSPTTCRLSVSGISAVQHNPPAHGAFSEEVAVNTASGIKWLTGERGRLGWSITYLPGCPHDFIDSGWRLSAEGYNNILDSATNFKLQLESLPSYPPDTLVMGTLHRSLHGAPLAHSRFSPFISWAPVPKVVTIRRRVPQGRNVSPF